MKEKLILLKKKKIVSRTQQTLNVWAITVFIWSIYRYYFKTTLPILADELLIKPIVFLLPLGWYIYRYERSRSLEAVDIRLKNASRDILVGVIIGCLFFVAGMFGYWSKFQHFQVFQRINWISLPYYLVISLASSIWEEILSRGFVLKRLYEESKNMFSSAFLASFLFFFLHVPILFSNPRMTGMLLIQVMITDIILSLAVSFIYLQRRNLIVPILIHFFYNLSIYIFTS